MQTIICWLYRLYLRHFLVIMNHNQQRPAHGLLSTMVGSTVLYHIHILLQRFLHVWTTPPHRCLRSEASSWCSEVMITIHVTHAVIADSTGSPSNVKLGGGGWLPKDFCCFDVMCKKPILTTTCQWAGKTFKKYWWNITMEVATSKISKVFSYCGSDFHDISIE